MRILIRIFTVIGCVEYNGADCVVLGAAKKNGQDKIGLHTNRQKERWKSHSRNTFSWFGPYQRGFMTCGCPVSVRVSDFCCDGQAHRLTWAKFSREYRHELFIAGSLDKANRTIKNHDQKFTLRVLESLAKRGNVTLMCHCAENASTLPSLAF